MWGFGLMGMIKMMKAGEEECVQRRDKIKNSCGNKKQKRKDSLVEVVRLEMCFGAWF